MSRIRHTEGDPVIDTRISLRRAGEDLGIDPKEVKGAARALGIKLHATGTAILMDLRDFSRLKERLGSLEPAAVAVDG